MNGNTITLTSLPHALAGLLPALGGLACLAHKALAAVLLGSIRSLLKANRGAPWGRSFGSAFPKSSWIALAALWLWHLSEEGDSS